MPRNPGKFKIKRGGGHSFSRDLSRLDSDGNEEGKAKESSSEEESSEEEQVSSRPSVGALPPIVDSESEGEEDGVAGLSRNLNSTTLAPGTAASSGPAPTLAGSRLGEMTAEKVAAARKERKAAAKGAPKVVKAQKQDGDSSESDVEPLIDNRNAPKVMKVSALAAPRELSRREK